MYLTVDVTFYRFCDHWRFVSQRFAFLGAFIVYLESDRLITRPELAEMLGGTCIMCLENVECLCNHAVSWMTITACTFAVFELVCHL